MKSSSQADEQAALWNGVAGRAWVESQDLIDQVFKPMENRLVEEAAALRPGGVLDIGCGSGGVTLAIARALGPDGHCTGVDISGPMIDAARARASEEATTATFMQADAQAYAFEPGSFDLIVSRFGVMFFADFVAAFQNLRRAARPGGEVRLITFRGTAENPFMTAAERAAAPLLPDLPPRLPDAPGQFALADLQRIQGILEQSGWAGTDIQPLDVTCTFPESELTTYFTQLGPVAAILAGTAEPTRSQVIAAMRAAFEPYVHGHEVRFEAACWLIRAQA